jgi:hypothetical protein
MIMEVDVFCICVEEEKKKRRERENGKKMLTGRVMIVFLCFPSSLVPVRFQSIDLIRRRKKKK